MVATKNTFKTQQDIENRLASINYKPGQIIKIVYGKDLGNGVEKITTYYGRLGVGYENMAITLAKREQGIAKSTRKKSDFEVGKYLLQNIETKLLKLKIYNAFNDNLLNKSQWYYDNQQTTKQWLIDNGLYKEKPKSKDYVCQVFNVMISDLISLG